MTKLFLGVDAGGSSTRAWIADHCGFVIGAGQASGGFPVALLDSVLQAQKAAGVSEDAVFTAACMGFSGGAEGKESVAREVVPAQAYFLTHDAWIALTGAANGGPGIVTIAGTGSMAFGRNREGQTARAGGWGYAFGDEGSAYDLVRQAIRAALREEEGRGPRTALREALLEESGARDMGARDINDLLHRFYVPPFTSSRVAALAPVVEATALRGDGIAQELLASAAQSLALLTGAVRRKLFAAESEVDVRHYGGVFRCRAIQARFKLLLEMEEGTRVSAPAFEPAGGALIEAFRMAGARCTLKNAPQGGR